ncbi:phosphatidylglycerophosphatase A [Helicobacter sp. MIT 01-3238]|uniref:phosphatidylglycerophosphatase A family protein n=1 Tax=Helicobacter sp. MIT 01-3238 TaxID=398627 RepID=UPI000E1F56DF|nr:phosphatidylglycerophosphatase A [Helicobacter sp. MIT 01-3238]RDU54501.1 phosphatidylglycerophosphatase A [Helicobacter sp. MIT 01-3238]
MQESNNQQENNQQNNDSSPKPANFSNLANLAQIAFLSVLWVGKCPKASGTMGSIAGVALGLPILYLSSQTLFLLSVFVGLFAIKQVNIYEARNEGKEGFSHDEGWIVIDEVVGVWIALSIACFGEVSAIGVGSAFVLFRVFDIWKPSLIGKIDREAKGGLGVVGDDALAGIIAGLASLVVIEVFGYLVGFYRDFGGF